jgi:predicted SAM-dependent methyltransferase
MLKVRSSASNIAHKYKNFDGLLLNIGCGPGGKEGWINLDCIPSVGVNCIYDARKELPFPDNSVKGIFTEHFLEHLDYTEEAPYFLAECYRVLQNEGVLRIVVPDAEKYLKAYIQDGWESLKSIRPLDEKLTDCYFGYTYNTKMELINVVFRQHGEHKFLYDYETLELLLGKSGFSDICKQCFGVSIMPDICIDKEIRSGESLYIDAVKR